MDRPCNGSLDDGGSMVGIPFIALCNSLRGQCRQDAGWLRLKFQRISSTGESDPYRPIGQGRKALDGFVCQIGGGYESNWRWGAEGGLVDTGTTDDGGVVHPDRAAA